MNSLQSPKALLWAFQCQHEHKTLLRRLASLENRSEDNKLDERILALETELEKFNNGLERTANLESRFSESISRADKNESESNRRINELLARTKTTEQEFVSTTQLFENQGMVITSLTEQLTSMKSTIDTMNYSIGFLEGYKKGTDIKVDALETAVDQLRHQVRDSQVTTRAAAEQAHYLKSANTSLLERLEKLEAMVTADKTTHPPPRRQLQYLFRNVHTTNLEPVPKANSKNSPGRAELEIAELRRLPKNAVSTLPSAFGSYARLGSPFNGNAAQRSSSQATTESEGGSPIRAPPMDTSEQKTTDTIEEPARLRLEVPATQTKALDSERLGQMPATDADTGADQVSERPVILEKRQTRADAKKNQGDRHVQLDYSGRALYHDGSFKILTEPSGPRKDTKVKDEEKAVESKKRKNAPSRSSHRKKLLLSEPKMPKGDSAEPPAEANSALRERSEPNKRRRERSKR